MPSAPTTAPTTAAPGVGVVDKSGLADPPLTSAIRRIFYLSSEGTHQEHEVFPQANPRMLQRIREVDAIVYGMGSLFTSVCPSLALRGVGEAIAGRAPSVPRIVLLNGSHDRETRFVRHGVELKMDASEVLEGMTMVLNRKCVHGGVGIHCIVKYMTLLSFGFLGRIACSCGAFCSAPRVL